MGNYIRGELAKDLSKIDMATVAVRFWSKVEKSDGCWEWAAARDPVCGYGWFRLNGRMWRASQISILLTTGKWPSGCACHRCDNPPCVRPEHLYDGTHEQNMGNMVSRGRFARVLSDDHVRRIHAMASTGAVHREIAEEFSVSRETVGKIARGRIWSHVTTGKTRSPADDALSSGTVSSVSATEGE